MADETKKQTRPGSGQRFPFISLPKALDRARELYKVANVHEVALAAAVTSWGYGDKSSGGLQTIAALKSFGLAEDSGSGGARKIKLTDSALKIIRDPRDISPERDALITQAALLPQLHREVIEKYNGMPPSDMALTTYLRLEKGLSDDASLDFIKEFTSTMSIAKLEDSVTIQDMETASTPTYNPPIIQPVAGGSMPFVSPAMAIDGKTDIKFMVTGNRIHVSAVMDKAGVARLKKILDANEPLLEDEAEGGK
ncbi:MAG: hypothetical protein GC129_01955 [Proteobacteria bacterium]|nr:hypothetical protein [Pseudomonadota bacterium]